MKIFLIAFLCFFSWYGFAAKIPTKVELQPASILKENGALRGGTAGQGFSLIDLRSSSTKNNKSERLVLDIGDAAMQKLKGSVGYYNVELKNSKRVVIDLTQTFNSKLTEGDLN